MGYRCQVVDVEGILYRGSIPVRRNFRFLNRLKIKTLLVLREKPLKEQHECSLWSKRNGVVVIWIKAEQAGEERLGIGKKEVEDVLKVVLDTKMYPLYLADVDGVSHTTPVVGCLRKLQGWAMEGILSEMERYEPSLSDLPLETFINNFGNSDNPFLLPPPPYPLWLWPWPISPLLPSTSSFLSSSPGPSTLSQLTSSAHPPELPQSPQSQSTQTITKPLSPQKERGAPLSRTNTLSSPVKIREKSSYTPPSSQLINRETFNSPQDMRDFTDRPSGLPSPNPRDKQYSIPISRQPTSNTTRDRQLMSPPQIISRERQPSNVVQINKDGVKFRERQSQLSSPSPNVSSPPSSSPSLVIRGVPFPHPLSSRRHPSMKLIFPSLPPPTSPVVPPSTTMSPSLTSSPIIQPTPPTSSTSTHQTMNTSVGPNLSRVSSRRMGVDNIHTPETGQMQHDPSTSNRHQFQNLSRTTSHEESIDLSQLDGIETRRNSHLQSQTLPPQNSSRIPSSHPSTGQEHKMAVPETETDSVEGMPSLLAAATAIVHSIEPLTVTSSPKAESTQEYTSKEDSKDVSHLQIEGPIPMSVRGEEESNPKIISDLDMTSPLTRPKTHTHTHTYDSTSSSVNPDEDIVHTDNMVDGQGSHDKVEPPTNVQEADQVSQEVAPILIPDQIYPITRIITRTSSILSKTTSSENEHPEQSDMRHIQQNDDSNNVFSSNSSDELSSSEEGMEISSSDLNEELDEIAEDIFDPDFIHEVDEEELSSSDLVQEVEQGEMSTSDIVNEVEEEQNSHIKMEDIEFDNTKKMRDVDLNKVDTPGGEDEGLEPEIEGEADSDPELDGEDANEVAKIKVIESQDISALDLAGM
ncbi:hypothetical protein TREMEDRAFT_61171 [Tremella mesenterica DSM 1558]|uniref:uncharacterized protein n=1 Tax=Tremella mesenterica (strain ATCC 24925 / CBS 8224 / DSM 1558 / NBRC 9311 / NRRL Y-6157 / RJB 2259-6 / UBC 559-6) TaxID=578456 RepID=UPI0003F4A033|nr:uncharacterized protein TREMEDRAFT_61171 [Tremella mesenterica DSM 1558]EIW70663.1 hypothetical protein TREMEDRAFT_61171 [Tremella mesenterica DSM 1558]